MLLERLRAVLGTVLEGKSEVIDHVLVGVLAGGHVLLEDVPGVGKTTLAKGIAKVFDVAFGRVQFTPDLLPSDILGAQVLNPREGSFAFHRGPVFTNVLVADEINRASPRTQAALLEAMNEAQVTVDGTTYPLPAPFFVIATQNPADFSGTYPLPEAQLDRFLLRIGIGYPNHESALKMLFTHQKREPVDSIEKVAEKSELLALMAKVREITVSEDVARYALRIAEKTRDVPEIELGVSPRGVLALFRASQARALLLGRSYVSPIDVQALAASVLAHRVRLRPQARHGGKSETSIVAGILRTVEVPT